MTVTTLIAAHAVTCLALLAGLLRWPRHRPLIVAAYFAAWGALWALAGEPACAWISVTLAAGWWVAWCVFRRRDGAQ